MRVWIVTSPFSQDVLPDELFQRYLLEIDPDSRTRVQRFYRRQDAWRCLVGRLLPRVLLKEHSVPQESVVFGRTEAGKPFIECSNEHPAIGYNITHDNDTVAMVSRLGDKTNANKIGIDIMKCALPKGETISSFLHAIGDTLTQSELAVFTSELDPKLAVQYIFRIWTVKEAYTKALGMGLGFDFKRIEYNVVSNSVIVDGGPTLGWEFLMFTMEVKDAGDVYQGAVASWVGGERTRMEFIQSVEDDPRFLFKDLSNLTNGL